MSIPPVDSAYLEEVLKRLLEIPSPSGMTDEVVRHTLQELDALGVKYELTRRGAVRAHLEGEHLSPRRAVIGHLDTLGAIVKRLKENGRLAVVPIGHWSSRFAEGARVTVHSESGRTFRGSILPLKASGHTYNEEIDAQPVSWENVELRVDEPCGNAGDLWDLGLRIGDFVSIDTNTEFTASGYINSRHLDDKAGVAAMLAAVKAVRDAGTTPPLDCFVLFTISEEVGVGASHILHGDIAEMVSVDNGTIAPGQNTSEFGATIAMQDSTGPFDRHLTQHLIGLCGRNGIEFSRDIFRYYRSDAAAALEAGNDIRTALVCFGLDASHGYERTHIRSLENVARLLLSYILSPPIFGEHEMVLGNEEDYPLIPTSPEQAPR